MSSKYIKYVVGIDFGAISSGFSIAHINDPSTKFTINQWDNGKSMNTDPKQFFTSILYKSNGEKLCGIGNTTFDKVVEGDLYINNIKQYILNIKQANEELGKKKEGLTIEQVVTDYLEYFINLAIARLEANEEFQKIGCFETDFKLENIRFCLACPSSQIDFMKECFINAGIVKKEDAESRLVFVTETNAAAYHCISLDRQTTKMVHDQTYLVCEIGHSNFGMSKIQADTTEYLSTVTSISEELGMGSMTLENNLVKFLKEKKSKYKLNQEIIDELVHKFVEDFKFNFGMLDAIDQEEEEVQMDNNSNITTTTDDREDNINGNENNSEGESDDDFDEDELKDDDEDEPEEEDEAEDEAEDETANDLVFTASGDVASNNDTTSQINDLQIGAELVETEQTDSVALDANDANGAHLNISYKELYENVFLPYIQYIIDYILKIDKETVDKTKSESIIFLSGKYSSDGLFYEKLLAAEDGKLSQFVKFLGENNTDVVSLGAVSFGLRLYKLQTPFFVGSGNSDHKKLDRENGGSKFDLNGTDFIIGIDFGTTFTGCSYADYRDKTKVINTIKTGWPGGNAVSFGKTPTLIMYDKKMRTKFWGQEAKTQVEYHTDLNLLGNFKLFLSPKCAEDYYGVNNKDIKEIKAQNGYINGVKNEETSQDNRTKNKSGKQINKKHVNTSVDAIDVIADYLKAVKEHVVKHITNAEKKKKSWIKRFGTEEFKFQYVITVPAMWSISARETMAEAAIQATIIKRNELHRLRIITEPEAAALFCENKYSDLILDPENPKAGSNFIVCDAGGGTVDLVTFALQYDEKERPMIHQIGEGSGDTCGSSYVDSNFKKYLEDFYKNIGLDVNFGNTNFNRVMDDFIKMKCNFKSNPDKDSFHSIKLPAERTISDFTREPKNEKYILTEGKTVLKIRHSEMKTEIFDPIISRVLKLIEEQLDQAKEGNEEIKTILLIGGFSRNEYLQQRVKEHFHGICSVGVPEEGIAAISHGAVSYALNPRMISMKSAGQSLALEVCAPFDKSKKDILGKKVFDSCGNEFAKNRLEYFVKKAQNLDKGGRDVYVKKVQIEYPQSALIAIFSCDFKEGEKDETNIEKKGEKRDGENDENRDNWRYVSRFHSKIMEETIELPHIPSISKGTRINFDVSLKMDHIGVTVTMKCLDRNVNKYIPSELKADDNTWTIVRKCNLIVFRGKKPLLQYSLVNSRFVFGST